MNTGAIDFLIVVAKAKLATLTDRLDMGRITYAEFKEQFRELLIQLYADAAESANNGRPLSEAQREAIAFLLRQQFERTGEFSIEELFDEYENNAFGLVMFGYRLGLYLTSARPAAWKVWTVGQQESQEDPLGIRILDAQAVHCIPCIMYAALPAMPVSQMVAPGEECTCRMNCKCRIELV